MPGNNQSDAVQCTQPVFQWPTPLPFCPIQYIPASESDTIPQWPVRTVNVTAHVLLPNGGNHWCFYLEVDNRISVWIDPSPTGPPGTVIQGGTKANIIVSRLEDPISEQAQHTSTLNVAPESTVGNFLNVIINAGRERYEFDQLGRGCRKWVTDQIDLFLQHGLIQNAVEANAAKDAILTEFDNRCPTGRRYPLVDGEYYAEKQEKSQEIS